MTTTIIDNLGDGVLVKYYPSVKLFCISQEDVTNHTVYLEQESVEKLLKVLHRHLTNTSCQKTHYKPDDAPVPAEMIEHLRATNDQDGFTPTQSLLTSKE